MHLYVMNLPAKPCYIENNLEEWSNNPHTTGTSIMAVEFMDGVVLGADSRTTTGAYIANRYSDKLTKISDNIYCCRSGSSADTQAIADVVAYTLNFHQSELGELPMVQNGAAICRELCYNYRDSISAGLVVAGWDRRKGGQVYSIPAGGMCLRQPVAIGGSGSSYVYGYVDANFRQSMMKEECVEFVVNTLSLAMERDGSSGGIVRVGIINEDGIERRIFQGDELTKFNKFT